MEGARSAWNFVTPPVLKSACWVCSCESFVATSLPRTAASTRAIALPRSWSMVDEIWFVFITFCVWLLKYKGCFTYSYYWPCSWMPKTEKKEGALYNKLDRREKIRSFLQNARTRDKKGPVGDSKRESVRKNAWCSLLALSAVWCREAGIWLLRRSRS